MTRDDALERGREKGDGGTGVFSVARWGGIRWWGVGLIFCLGLRACWIRRNRGLLRRDHESQDGSKGESGDETNIDESDDSAYTLCGEKARAAALCRVWTHVDVYFDGLHGCYPVWACARMMVMNS
jgi:hypothetical protein